MFSFSSANDKYIANTRNFKDGSLFIILIKGKHSKLLKALAFQLDQNIIGIFLHIRM
jgi:hypothetical protein